MIDLWEFQREDVEKLRSHSGALITNEMGTGKTREALALDLIHREECKQEGIQRTLVVAKYSTLTPTWEKHFAELCPELKVAVVDAKNRDGSFRNWEKLGGEVFICHWQALVKIPELKHQLWLHTIADEVQMAKNRKAQQTQALKAIKPFFKTGLSGTPVTNKPHDYWSILNWLYPKVFRSYWKFFNTFIEFEVKYPEGYKMVKGVKNIPLLLQMVSPFTVRHLKKEQCCPHHPKGVLPYLPDKYYDPPDGLKVDLLPDQRRAYDQMKKDMIAWVGENQDKPVVAPVAIAKLVRLQQFSVAYAKVETVKVKKRDTGDIVEMEVVRLSEPSSKLDALMELVDDNPEKQFVVFTQFSQLVNLLGIRLTKAGISHGLYTGETSKTDRDRIVSEFQAGRLRIFGGTIKAGGVGLDLFAASTVVFLDRDWSPAENKQAEDRLHRSGQKNAVQVVDIMARGTVDAGRKQMLIQKWDWIREMLGDTQH